MFKKLASIVLLGLSITLGFISSSYAALPAGVSAAVTEAQGDGVELGGLMLAMAVAVGVIFWLKRKV
jgi:hypothetical protein